MKSAVKSADGRNGLEQVTPQEQALLSIQHLNVEFRTRGRYARVLRDVSFDLARGETLALLGESGCGKTVTAKTIMGILDATNARVVSGAVYLQGADLLRLSEEQRRSVRSERVAMVFQDALSALNPVFSVGFQLSEMFRVHRGMSRGDSRRRAIELLEAVKIPAAAHRYQDYPHQFSGGMRQRVVIAVALALDPDVLIADEPTTALDVTVQAQIMQLLTEIRHERNMSLILITHDMGVVADVADRVVVMYAGEVVEQASVDKIYAQPAHPYTKALLDSIPRIDVGKRRLNVIGGMPPDLSQLPTGCSFSPRCGYATELCASTAPGIAAAGPNRLSRCHHWHQVVNA